MILDVALICTECNELIIRSIVGVPVLIGTVRSFPYDSASTLECVWTLARTWQPSFFDHMQFCRPSNRILVSLAVFICGSFIVKHVNDPIVKRNRQEVFIFVIIYL